MIEFVFSILLSFEMTLLLLHLEASISNTLGKDTGTLRCTIVLFKLLDFAFALNSICKMYFLKLSTYANLKSNYTKNDFRANFR